MTISVLVTPGLGRRNCFYLHLIASLLILTVSTPSWAAKKVIIDTDPGTDDALAIMLALNSPELDIRGITVVPGNVTLEMGLDNLVAASFTGVAIPMQSDSPRRCCRSLGHIRLEGIPRRGQPGKAICGGNVRVLLRRYLLVAKANG